MRPRLYVPGLLALALIFSAALARAEQVPSGTTMILRLDTDINPDGKHNDDFRGQLDSPVFINSKEVLPMGTRVEGQVRGDKQHVILSPRYMYLPNGQRLYFNAAVRDIDRKKLRAEGKEGTIQSSSGSRADTARTAAQIGMMGAGVGVMTTGSAKGMGIGALAGVGAVLIGSKIANRHKETYIPAGTTLTLSLSRPLTVPDGLAQQPPSYDPNNQTNGPEDLDRGRPHLRRRVERGDPNNP